MNFQSPALTDDNPNANTDSAVVLTPFSSPGVLPPDNTTAVHWGFLRAFNSVADTVISIMEEQYTFYPHYRLVCTGVFPSSIAPERIATDKSLRPLSRWSPRFFSGRNAAFEHTWTRGEDQAVHLR